MRFPSEPKIGENIRSKVIELMRWSRANQVRGLAGGLVKNSPNGKLLVPGGVAVAAGRGGVAVVRKPWQPAFSVTGAEGAEVYKCRFNLGSVNGLVCGNWDAEFTLPSTAGSVVFALLTVSTAGGKATGAALSVSASAPAEDSIAKDTPPVEFVVVLGVLDRSSAKMIVETNLEAVASEVFREAKAAPVDGGEPFSRWWRWSLGTLESGAL